MPAPSQLYKFHGYSLAALQSLLTATVWSSHPRKLNDPFDCQHWIDTAVSRDEYAYLVPEMHKFITGWNFGSYPVPPDSPDYQKAFDRLARDFLDLVNDFGVYSVSARCDHLLLWAHYAASHTGFVIQYDTSQPLDASAAELHSVSYGKSYPALHVRDFVRQYSASAERHTLFKGTAWEYEQEWRLISRNPDSLLPRPWKITGIILGHRMAPAEQQAIRRALSDESGISYFVAHPSHSDYSVTITEVT